MIKLFMYMELINSQGLWTTRHERHKWRRRARAIVWRKRTPRIEQDGEWELERLLLKWGKSGHKIGLMTMIILLVLDIKNLSNFCGPTLLPKNRMSRLINHSEARIQSRDRSRKKYASFDSQLPWLTNMYALHT